VIIAALVVVLFETPAWAGKKKKVPAPCSKGESASVPGSKNPDCATCAPVITPSDQPASFTSEAYMYVGAPADDPLASVMDLSGWDTSVSLDASDWAPGGGGCLDPDPESGAFAITINVAMGGGGAPG